MGLWQIISATDLTSKAILLLLLGMSIVVWALALYKKLVIARKIKALKQAQGLLANVKSMDDLLARLSVVQTTFAGELIAQFLTDFKRLLRIYESGAKLLADRDWYLLQATVGQRVDEVIAQEESLLPVLSTSAQAAPLLGLFGTVWGLIHSFMAIAQQRTADIAAVAPGIAEALTTTLMGLVVAIPALILYNYLSGRVRELEGAIGEVSDSCVWVMRGVLESDPGVTVGVTKPSEPVSEEMV